MASPYQRSNTPADARHSSRLGLFQRFYLVEVLLGLKLTGIRFFATGGIGGVHRGTFDVSADLFEMARTPVAVRR